MSVTRQKVTAWTQAAMRAGCSHAGSDPSDEMLADISRCILERSDPEHPHEAVIQGCFSSRADVLARRGLLPEQDPEPGREAYGTQQSVSAWLAEIFSPDLTSPSDPCTMFALRQYLY